MTFAALTQQCLEGEGCNCIPLVSQGKTREPTNADIALGIFMSQLISEHAEHSPDRDGIFLNPGVFQSFEFVHQLYCIWYTQLMKECDDYPAEQPEEPMTYPTFKKRIRQHYPDLRIPKTNKFAQCDVCFSLAQRRDLADTAAKKQHWNRILNKHREDVRADKIVYYNNRYASSLFGGVRFNVFA